MRKTVIDQNLTKKIKIDQNREKRNIKAKKYNLQQKRQRK
jgi:hypothetical protein